MARDAVTPVSGTATVVLGDVAGSTRLWVEQPDAMSHASKRLATIIAELVAAHGGHRPREQGEGDNLVAAFRVGSQAVAFALALNERLASEPWPGGLTIAMRLGVHTGDIEWDDDTGYLGSTFNRCARLRDLGHARMILLSQATRDIVADTLPDGAVIQDLGSHQLRDLSREEHVFLLRRRDDPTEFPPLKSVSSLPNNLPVPVTSLIGREDDIVKVARSLLEHRLVTLTGAGGSGKTRLAQHVASEALQYAPDGAWWVDLMPVTDDERVPIVIGEAAGITDVPGGSRGADVLAAGLGHKQLILVVDNCEHLIDAVAETVEVLLERCSQLRVVATSRETLDLAGEHAVRVRPLAGAEGDEITLEQLLAAPATRLFLDRAATLEPSTLDARARRAVAAICQRLDGMPLAIELAAARTSLLSVTDIEAALDDRFGLLAAGRRGRRSGARQRTLEASIAWSYDLLTEDEKVTLCRLAVFPGPFDLDGARDVGASGDAARGLDLLTALVDKSLVTVGPAADGRRYRLLESIRHYGLERLRERGEADAARHAHLDHTLAQLQKKIEGHQLFSEASGEVHRSEPALMDDIRAADSWAMTSGRVADLVGLYWPNYVERLYTGAYFEPLASLLKVLDHPDLDLLRNARAHTIATVFLGSLNRHEEAIVLSERAIQLGRELVEETGDEGPLIGGLSGRAHACTWSSAGGSDAAREAIAIARPHHPSVKANAIIYCAAALGIDGYEQEGLDAALQAVQAARSADLPHHEALAANYVVAGALRLARPMQEVRDLLRQADEAIPADVPRMRALLAWLAGVWTARAAADADEAFAWVERGFAHAGPPGTATHAMMTLAEAAASWIARDPDASLTAATKAGEMFATSSHRWAQLLAGILRAYAHNLRGDAEAMARIAEVRALLPSEGFTLLRGQLDVVDASARLQNDPPSALQPALRAFDVVRRHGTAAHCDDAFAVIARVFEAEDRPRDAARTLGSHERFLSDRGYTSLYADDLESVTEGCRSTLGEDVFAAEHAAGTAMTLAEATSWLLRGRTGDDHQVERPVAGWRALTPTEIDVARAVAKGLTNKQAAEALFVSENTIKTHLKSIYAKLDVTGRAALATEVARNTDGSHPA